MGMYDTVIVLDETLSCPHGHPVNDFQTKSFPDPSMSTYLIEAGRVYRVAGTAAFDHEVASDWRIEGNQAVYQRRHELEPVTPPAELLFYTHCRECEPVLVRTDRASFYGDLVDERQLWVEFRTTLRSDGPVQIERISGTRDDLVAELRHDGQRVLDEDEPLAIAHREIRAARKRPRRRR